MTHMTLAFMNASTYATAYSPLITITITITASIICITVSVAAASHHVILYDTTLTPTVFKLARRSF